MATVTGLTAERMLEIESQAIVGGAVLLDNLVLTRHDGSTFNAGSVRGPKGDKGDTGATGAQLITYKPVTDAPSTYPTGYSTFSLAFEAGWPTTLATIFTTRYGSNRTFQLLIAKTSGQVWVRTEADSNLWGPWSSLQTKATSDADLWKQRKVQAMQNVLTGGGIRYVGTNGVFWSERFMTLGTGNDAHTPDGYFSIEMPPNGTAIPMLDHPTITSVTVADDRVPIPEWCALYYDLPLGSAATSIPSRFRMVEYSYARDADLPSSYILVAARNADVFSPYYTWGDGRQQDYWRLIDLANGWLHYLNGWPAAEWRFTGDGRVYLRGLIHGGAPGGISSAFPLSLLPAAGKSELYHVPSNGGICRIDVNTDVGIYVNNYSAGGSNAWVSLAGLNWFPNNV